MWDVFLSLYQRIAARRMFSRWAESYEFDVMDNDYSAVDRVAQAAIKYIASQSDDFRDEPDIVDVGIGTGLLAEQLQDSLPCRIIGLDFTDDMLAICAQKNVAELLIKCDVGRDVWPLENGSMDLVLSAGLFEYLTPPMAQHFITQSYKTLQQNGVLIFTYVPRGTGEKTTKLWRGHSGTYIVSSYTPQEIEKMLQQNNLEIVEHSAPFAGSIFEDGSSYDYRLIAAKRA